jgi:UDP-GlcNAc:undecaprenyl-phosphate GlcNAc-1-phosphate transferase
MATSAISVTGQIDPNSLQSGRLLAPALIPILLPIAILIVPLLDFILAVTRRLRAGKSPFAADRKHLHHRLLDMGHTHFQSVLIIYGWTAVLSVGTLLFLFLPAVWVFAILTVGIVGCAWVTFAPKMSRRKPGTVVPIDEEAL